MKDEDSQSASERIAKRIDFSGNNGILNWLQDADRRKKRENEEFQRISDNPQIQKVFNKYGCNSERLEEIYQLFVLAGFGEKGTRSIINNPERLEKFLRMEADGVSFPEILSKMAEMGINRRKIGKALWGVLLGWRHHHSNMVAPDSFLASRLVDYTYQCPRFSRDYPNCWHGDMADLENDYSVGFCLSRWWNHMAGAGTRATNTHIGFVRRLSIRLPCGEVCLTEGG